MDKLINRMPGLHLLISSLPGKALRLLVDIARLAGRFNISSQSRVFPSILYFPASEDFCCLLITSLVQVRQMVSF